ncbi:hypothetical protein Acr_06g0013770 [Actinidia rufa]|uniref:DUF7870 domain-containing protein n=1 Tax=Actinidia rufa TaxID=165716 RepID=A0A7J0EV22_9ERIC|nr:hypothetical protein Acr_06g0013770 [Actinidia rufa]
MMESACRHRAKSGIEARSSKNETIGLNSDTLLIIKLPSSQALRVLSRSVFLAMLILALPCIGSILKGPTSSIYEEIGSNSIGFDLLPLLFRDLSDEGLLKKGDKALILSSGVENFMDYSESLSENEIALEIQSDLDSESTIRDEKFDFVLTLNSNTAKSADGVLKIGGLLVMQLSNDPLNAFQKHLNYKIVYLRRFNSTVVAMRKTSLINESVNSPRKLQQCGGMVEAKKAALKGLEEALFEPPPRQIFAKSSNYLNKIKFLPDLLGDSLESYGKRIFITDDNGGSDGGVQWLYQNYPMRNQYFESYNLEIEVSDVEIPEVSGVSDWLTKNVKEEDFVCDEGRSAGGGGDDEREDVVFG